MLAYPNFPDSGADYCHFTRTSGQQKPGNDGLFLAEAKQLHPQVPQPLRHLAARANHWLGLSLTLSQ